MRLPDSNWRLSLAGLVVGLAVGLVLTGLVMGTGQGRLAQLGAQQQAVIVSAAAAERLAQLEDPESSAQQLAQQMVDVLPALDAMRVVDIGSRSLTASTHAEDSATSLVPRRLKREEKPMYDQARELQAARLTNTEEDNARKAEVLAELLPDGRLEMVLPVIEDGKVTGSVQTWCSVSMPAATNGTGSLPLLVAAACLAVFLVSAIFVRRGVWPLLLALVILVAGLWIHAALSLDNLADKRVAVEAMLRDQALALAEQLPVVQPATIDDPSAWDRGTFGQPRGWFTAAGVLDEAGIRADQTTELGRFSTAAMVLGLLAVILHYWVAAGWANRTWNALVSYRNAYGFVLPAMVGMIVLVFFPFAYGVLLSFSGQTLYNVNQPLYDLFVGFDNYVQILSDFNVFTTAEDGSRIINFQSFYWTLGFTLLWTVSNVAIGTSLGLLLALILNTKGLAFKPIYRILLILPWAVPNYITALIWKGMFHRQFGVINQMIVLGGGEPIAWFDSWLTSFFAVLMTNAWLSFPFMMVVSLGALQSISADLYEAARVDGADKWQQFRFVTLPSLKPALVPAVILSVIWTFNMFNIIYLVSQGEPANATEILITQAYKLAFEQYRYGYAAAYSVVIFIILLAYGVWQNRTTKATEGI